MNFHFKHDKWMLCNPCQSLYFGCKQTMRDKWLSNLADHSSEALTVCMYKVHTITSNPFSRLNAPAVVGKPFDSIIHHFHSTSDDVSTTQQISFDYFHTNLYCETIFPRFIYAHSHNNHISKLDRVSCSS